MKGTEERSFLQIREETFDVRIKRTKPKAWCVNGSVRALFGKLGHACLSEEKLFPCKAALRPLSLSLSLPPSLAHSSPRCAGSAGFLSADFPSLPLPPLGDVSYVLWSFLRFKNRVEHGQKFIDSQTVQKLFVLEKTCLELRIKERNKV